MSKEKTFTIIVYSDPGHSWAKVKRSVLHNLGIADNISSYSYQRGEYVYLEEDCDLSTLCMALNQRNTRIKFVEKHTDRDSRIRSYERYKPFDVVAFPDCQWETHRIVFADAEQQATETNAMAASRC